MPSEPDKPVLNITQAKLAFVAALWFGFVQARDLLTACINRENRLTQVEQKASKIDALDEDLHTVHTTLTALKGDVQSARDLCYTQQQQQASQLVELQNQIRELQAKLNRTAAP